MRALVTGGAGFIGSTLVDRLLEAGHDVAVVDNLVTGSRANLVAARRHAGDRLRVIELDIRAPELAAAVADQAPDVVFHLAAQADVRVSVADPRFDADVNVVGSLNVIEAARAAGAGKVVFASSGGTIYGEPSPEALPVDESHPQRPVSPYGVAKKVVGDYLFAFEQLHGLAWAGLALANVYGPRQDPHGEAGVVAIFAGRLLSGEPCTVFGDGTQTRDFVYVDDVVDAFVRAADRGAGIINVGTGEETSVNALYRAMADAAAVADPPVHAPVRVGELDRSSLAIGRAAAELGWAPQVDLATGTRAVLDWFRTERPAG
jgi:UDP-glucose 4-epimerase